MANGHYTENPCVYFDDHKRPHLNIFLHFYYEKSLPKWNKDAASRDLAEISKAAHGPADTEEKSGTPEAVFMRAPHSSDPWRYERQMSDALRGVKQNGKGFWATIKEVLGKRGVPVEEVFEEVKDKMRVPMSTEELEKAKEASEKLYGMLVKTGQLSQAEKVRDYASVLSGEIVLMKNGFSKYLLEEDVIEFMLKAERGVMIDFLRSYSEILPLDVAAKKIKVDELMVFDNYVVMFFDPKLAAFRFIQDKVLEHKSRDPILFGMIEGSNKLYYICDWTFKDDDLTMAKVESTIGRSARNLEESEIADTHMKINEFLTNMDQWLDAIRPSGFSGRDGDSIVEPIAN